MSSAAIFTFVTLILTVLAYWKSQALLHGVCILAWLVTTALLTNLTYVTSNTYLATGVGLVCVTMVIVETVTLFHSYMVMSTSRRNNYELRKADDRKRILNMTKRKEDLW